MFSEAIQSEVKRGSTYGLPPVSVYSIGPAVCTLPPGERVAAWDRLAQWCHASYLGSTTVQQYSAWERLQRLANASADALIGAEFTRTADPTAWWATDEPGLAGLFD